MEQTKQATDRRSQLAGLKDLVIDFAAPLALYYGMRLFGVDQWFAMVLTSVLLTVRLLYKIVKERKLEPMTVLTLIIVVGSTLVTLFTGDVRVLLARKSAFTAIMGLWILGSLWASRPFLFTVTRPLLPADTSASWERDWDRSPEFRKVMRRMTVAWGLAFLVDAAARVVMAYTLPVDLVPLLSAALLTVMLIAVVEFSKAYGRRMAKRQQRAEPVAAG